MESDNEIGARSMPSWRSDAAATLELYPSLQTMIMRRFALSASAMRCGQAGSSRHPKTLRSMINARVAPHRAGDEL
ncbi:MAG TPA: hypothetical protein VK754_00075 [Propionibacteriaceae bacterium]|nr:hypothetical protein [Propionibacteriaceae bacterium]